MEAGGEARSGALEYRKKLQPLQLHRLFDYLPGIYFVVKDRSGRVVMANEFAARLCGLESEAAMIGITDADLFSRERAEAYVRDDRRVLETGECIVDRVELAPDPHNSITWFLTTKIPLYGWHGDILGVACIQGLFIFLCNVLLSRCLFL